MAKTRRSVVVRGEEVSRARNAKGWSTEELARRAGYKVRTIQKIEAGEPVSPSTASDIAAALKLPYELLVPSPAVERPNMLRAHLILECDVREAAKSGQLRALIDLIAQFVPNPAAVKLNSLSLAGESLQLDMPQENVFALIALFPEFQDHALEAIAQTVEGGAFFRGEPHPASEGVSALVRLVESVRELRILAEDRPPPDEQPDDPPAPAAPVTAAPPDQPVLETPHREGEPAGETPPAVRYPEYSLAWGGFADLPEWRKHARSFPSPEREERLRYLDRLESELLGDLKGDAPSS